MNLAEIENIVYIRLGIGSAPDNETITLVRAFANETQREILQRKHFRIFRRRLLTCASTANSPFMALPQAAVRIFAMVDRTNDYYLEEKTMQWIRSMDPSLRAVAANPWAYGIYDMASPVAIQPSDASQLFVKSTSALDTQTAYLESVRTGGYFNVDSKAVNGVTAAGFTSTDVVAVNKFYINKPAVGAIGLFEDSGAGTELARIPIGRTFARYSLVHLYPVPSAAATFYVDAEVHVEDMVNGYDEPLLPEEFHNIIGMGIRAKMYEKREKSIQAKDVKAEMREEISRLISWVDTRSGLQNPGSGNRRFSQLGPWFPSGT